MTARPQQAARSARPRSRLLWLALAVVMAGSAAAGYRLMARGEAAAGADAHDAPAAPANTAEVTRATIADTRAFSGTLGHGEAFTVAASTQGVVTRLPEHGAATDRGAELFRVDEQPVTALIGAVPMYRDLAHGDAGSDVEQLIANLTALGHADCEATEEITRCVAEAIRAWQADVGLEDTGVVSQGDVVFVPEGTRVDTIHARVGEVITPGTPVLDLTGTDHVVGLEVDVRDRALVAVGTQATVLLPGGEETTGTVTAANVVAAGSAADAASDDTITAVAVTLDEPVDEALLGAPADVVIEVDERVDVLTVPVNALLAADGGHAVEVVAADATATIVPVDTGLFAAGRVEISGEGIEEGTVVVVAAR